MGAPLSPPNRRALEAVEAAIGQRRTARPAASAPLSPAQLAQFDALLRTACQTNQRLTAAPDGRLLCAWLSTTDPADPVVAWVIEQLDAYLASVQYILTTEGYLPVGLLVGGRQAPLLPTGRLDGARPVYRVAHKAHQTPDGLRLHPAHPIWRQGDMP